MNIIKILCFCLFFGINSFSQSDHYRLDVFNAFMVLKDGEKVVASDGIIEVNHLGKKVFYKDVKKKNKSMSFNKIDYLSSDKTILDYQKTAKILLKTFIVEKSENLYMLIAEDSEKKLITKTGRFSYDFGYKIFVIDNEGNLIDKIYAYGGPKVKNSVNRKEIEPFLKRNFPNCEELLKRIPTNIFSDDIEGYSLFDNPIYLNCE